MAWGVAALITSAIALFFLATWASWTDLNSSAERLCKKAGYAGGKYDPDRGIVCLTEHPQPFQVRIDRK